MIRKVKNWEIALTDFASKQINRAFEWGVTDCNVLAIGAMSAMTGDNLAESFAHSWDDRESAEVAAQEINAVDYLEMLGLFEVMPGFQQRGDIILLDQKDPWLVPCICMGQEVLVSSIAHKKIILRTLTADDTISHIYRIPN